MRRIHYFLILALVALGCSRQPKYKDPTLSIDDRVEDLLKRMTLEEKVAQLQSFRSFDTSAFDRDGNYIGTKDTAILKQGTGAFWGGGFRGSARERAMRYNGIQRFMMEKTRLGIPVFVFAEALHGYMAEGATSFPQAIALGSTWDTTLLEQVFSVAALEARARGVSQVLSPVIDLARDPRWGRTEECYGEDAYLVSRMGLAAIFGLQGRDYLINKEHVAVSLKHFAGHGQPEGGRNIAPVNYSEREFRSNHLYPFEMAVKRGKAHSVMASYNEWDGVPNHVNRKLLCDILRDEWGFYGFVMSDGGGMDVTYKDHLAAVDSAESGQLSIEAGVDYDLGSAGCFRAMAQWVKEGKVSREALDRAVRGILRVKFLCGLFDNPYIDPDKVDVLTNTPQHKALALKAAHEAMILLKNEKVLPLDSTKIKTLAVIGPNAADIHLGGYSNPHMQGVSVLEGIKTFAGNRIKVLYAEGCKITSNKECNWKVEENPVLNSPENDRKLIAEAVNIARQSDAVVLAIGENELVNREAWDTNHLGDVQTLELVGMQNELAKAVIATGKPVIVLLINGRPLAINEIAQTAPAIIECWYLGQETGNAVADALFGKINPSGKLTVTFPRSVGQLPCFYNHKPSRFREYVLADNSLLYPFGFGLSYTSFEYKSLKLSAKEIAPDGNIDVSVDVTNNGKFKGDEIVQLYIHDIVSLPVRPVQELKDFVRITLNPGETKNVTFHLTPDKLEAFDMNMKRNVQPGDFAIMVGQSSVSFLSDTLHVK